MRVSNGCRPRRCTSAAFSGPCTARARVAQDDSAAMRVSNGCRPCRVKRSAISGSCTTRPGVAQDYSAAMKCFEWLQTKEMHKRSAISGSCTTKAGQPQNTSEALRWLHKAQVQEKKRKQKRADHSMRETPRHTRLYHRPPPQSNSPLDARSCVAQGKASMEWAVQIVVCYVVRLVGAL